MELKNRITSYIVALIVLTMIFLPCANAQMGGRGSRGGGGGDMMGGNIRGDERDGVPGMSRGGDFGGRRGMPFQEEELTESQIDRVLKQLSAYNPTKAKELQDLRKTNKEQFTYQLRMNALAEIFNITWEDREYKDLLDWCEKFVPDEATGIKDLQDKNHDLYKKRLDTLEEKYRSIRHQRMPDELMRISVRDLQLNLKLRDLYMQYRTSGTTPEQKQTLKSDITDVVSEQYDQRIKRAKYELQVIEERIKNLTESFEQQKRNTAGMENPEVKTATVQGEVEMYTSPRRGGMMGRGPFVMPFTFPPMQDQNSYPAP